MARPGDSFPDAHHNLFELFVRAAKKELLNARKRKTLGLKNANRFQLEQMPPTIPAPPPDSGASSNPELR